METIAYPLGWVVIFILSATIHEAAHAWAAKRGGDLTAYAGGQVSLNPLPHIRREPWGMVVIPLFSAFMIGWPFGYASTPFDPLWAHNNPRKVAWMALAGPAANLLMVFLSATIIKLGILAGVFLEPFSVNLTQIVDPASAGLWTGVSIFISMLFTLNLILFILNLLPLPPLDGSNMVSLFLSEDSARSYRAMIAKPVFGILGLLLVWWLISPIIDWAFPSVMNILYRGANFQ